MASDPERKWNRRPLSPYFSSERDRDKDRTSPGPATSLTHGDIAQALLDSPDEGCTLDFSYKNLGDVGESGAEELATIGTDGLDDESIVLRVALGNNRLATLPMAFALLARLRYLNLRANNFTVFPDVLTVMPSLEILDISRNKLKRLPSQPGKLLELRIFSISKNRLTRLPEYIAKASNLTVFLVDHNPFEWPPKHVLEPLDNAEDADAMLTCIENVKKWIDEHGSGSSVDRGGKAPIIARKPSDESPRGIQATHSGDSYSTSDDSDTNTKFSLPRDGFSSITQHSRSFSTESDGSNYSTISESSGSEYPFHNEKDGEETKHPSPQKLSNILSSFLTSSPSVSPTLPSSNLTSTHDDYNSHTRLGEASTDDDTSNQQHGRNASYSVAREPSISTPHLATKKSLPNLRGSNLTVADRSRNIVPRPRLLGLTIQAVANGSKEMETRHNFKPPAPSIDRDAVSPHSGTSTDHSTHANVHTTLNSRAPRPQPANNQLRGVVAAAAEPIPSPIASSPQGPAPSMDVERNSYFRRLSTLPRSTVSPTIPEALLAMIDSARGILFAVSQIYQSLRHYTVFAIDDRLSGLLGKVLDPASTYMTHLINALDRFDSVSRRGLPSPAVCRGVLENCRDNVAVFGKVVGVLHLQLKVLTGSDDARYSRSLLLMLYGSMAEISNSWQTMVPHLEALQPLLTEHRPPPATASSSKIQIMTTPNTPSSASSTARNGIPPIPERSSAAASPIARTPTGAQGNNTTNGRSRMTRRHAGSFSTRDVQIGKSLPSTTEEVPVPSVPSPFSIPPLRSALRRPTITSQAPPLHPHSQLSSTESPSGSTHSRQGSSSPAVAGGSSSSYSLPPFAHQFEASNARATNPSLEVPIDSSKMVDEDLLITMETATETARSVWRMMDEVLHDTKETNVEILESLEWAQDITRRLKDEIQSMRSGTADGDRRAFWEDAHHFVKAVVNVSTILKAFSVSHPFSAILRSNIAKLTQSTQDFAILLQVSSFSPAPTPTPYSPALPTAMKPPAGGLPLSRARSAQATPSAAKLKPPELRDVPWSALPHQTFKLPNNL